MKSPVNLNSDMILIPQDSEIHSTRMGVKGFSQLPMVIHYMTTLIVVSVSM